jgi:hypothetical protein
LLWAVFPAHVRLSSSEDFPALLSLSQATAVFAAALAARRFSLLSFGAAVCITLFSVQVRPEGWLIVVAVILVFAAAAGATRLGKIFRRADVWVILLTAAVVAWEPAMHVAHRTIHESGAHSDIHPFSAGTWIELFSFHLDYAGRGIGNLSLNPLVSPPWIVILALAALVFSPGALRPIHLALLASYLVFAVAMLSFQMGIVPTMRLQVSYQWIMVVLAGAGFSILADRAGRLHRCMLPAAVLVLLCLSYLPYRALVRQVFASQMEYTFLKEALPKVPDGCTVVHLDGHVGNIDTVMPRWIPAEAGKQVEYEEISSYLAGEEDAEGKCFVYYRGLTCFSFHPESRGPAEQPLCAAMNSKPFVSIASESIPAGKFGLHGFRVKVVPLELRRLVR